MNEADYKAVRVSTYAYRYPEVVEKVRYRIRSTRIGGGLRYHMIPKQKI